MTDMILTAVPIAATFFMLMSQMTTTNTGWMMTNHNRNHQIAMNGDNWTPPDYFEQDDDTLSVHEAAENLIDNAFKSTDNNGLYYVFETDFYDLVKALEKEKAR